MLNTLTNIVINVIVILVHNFTHNSCIEFKWQNNKNYKLMLIVIQYIKVFVKSII